MWCICFSPEHNLELLRRTRDAVPAGARLLLVDFWTDQTHTQPPFAALMAGEFLVITGEGDVYSAEDVERLARDDRMAADRASARGRADQCDSGRSSGVSAWRTTLPHDRERDQLASRRTLTTARDGCTTMSARRS